MVEAILPARKTKLLFWLILGSLSVFFAEVVSGSYIFPYFTLWGIFVIMPLYTLHLLVLACVVFNSGKPGFYSLFLAGAIFGMYEAYITKVLWSPTWGDSVFFIGGIAAVEAVVLVLWWHPFWAFIIPLFIGEHMLTASRATFTGLPYRFRHFFNSRKARLFLPAFALAAGITQSANSPSLFHSVFSGLSTTGFLILLIYVWRERTDGSKYTIYQLLPGKREFQVIFVLLIVLYVLTGLAIRPEALPGISSQMNIWLIYGILFLLLYLNLKKSHAQRFEIDDRPVNISYKTCLLFSIIFTAGSASFKLIGGGMLFVLVTSWFGGSVLGILILLLSVRDTLS